MSIYKSMPADELEEITSSYLVPSWSYSKVTGFARNEKAFEMSYIYGFRTKSSASNISGQAYHAALDKYFSSMMETGEKLDLAYCQRIAYEYIDDVASNEWKLQKTTPTIDDCKNKAISNVTLALHNFFREASLYEDDIAEILYVEVYCSEYLTVNGVDIPLPCNARIDLVFRNHDGKVIITDHKSRATFTPEEEAALSIGVQAITYVLVLESKIGVTVDEVWFIENKISKNRDGSPQLAAIKVEITPNTRALYEALLYEPLKRMINAVSDPDYVYLINDADNYIDKAELYEFWAKTQISEIDGFDAIESKKDLIAQRRKKIRDASTQAISPQVIKSFKQNAAAFIKYDLSASDMTNAQKIEHTLRTFGVVAKVVHEFEGFSSNTYLLEISAGVKIARIHSFQMDIANALNVSMVRIPKELKIYEESSYIAIEFTKKRDRDLIYDPAEVVGYKIPLGKDNFNNTIYWDLDNHSTPHALVCGATGSGKSVELRTVIESAKVAEIPEIYVFDPKYEFIDLDGVMVFNEIADIEQKVEELVQEMQERVKNKKRDKILIVFDEFADALLNAFGPLEENLRAIVQKGRSLGFRVMAATQRASTKIITGDTKVNFPVQICFRVPKQVDSIVVLDEPGAEGLAGRGDGLIKSPEYSDELTRFQSFFIP